MARTDSFEIGGVRRGWPNFRYQFRMVHSSADTCLGSFRALTLAVIALTSIGIVLLSIVDLSVKAKAWCRRFPPVVEC